MANENNLLTNPLSRNKALLLVAEKYSVTLENRQAGEYRLCQNDCVISLLYSEEKHSIAPHLSFDLQRLLIPTQSPQLKRLSIPTKRDLVSYDSNIIRIVQHTIS